MNAFAQFYKGVDDQIAHQNALVDRKIKLEEQQYEMDKLRREAQYRQGLGRIFAPQPTLGAPQTPQMPPQGDIGQSAPTAPPQVNMPPQTPPQQNEVVVPQSVNGENQVVVTGQIRRQPPTPPMPTIDYAAQVAQYEQAANMARANGQLQDAERFQSQANNLRVRPQQEQAARLSALLSVQNDDELFLTQLDYLLETARQQGQQIPSDVVRALTNKETRGAALRAAINLANPEEATKEAINTTGTYDQFRPYQTDNLGDRYGVFDPRAGKFINSVPVGINPTAARGQDMSAATQRRGQDISAAQQSANRELQRFGIEVRRKIAAGQLSVAQGNLAIRQRQMELGLPIDSEVDSGDIIWD